MKILFVCLGNICRSPAGENIFTHLCRKAGVLDQFDIDSAGTAAWHIGKSPDHRMTQTLQSRGVEVHGNARHLTKEDLAFFDLILTMDNENFSNVQALDPHGKYAHKIEKFTHYCKSFPHTEVPDPYYGGQDGFNLVADLLEDGCHTLLQHYSTK